ncbi:MAG: FecR family protein [Acidobacteriota bacterium]
MNDFDRLIDSIRNDVPPVGEAADRVRAKLNEAAGANSLCGSFRADFAAYRTGTLAEGRRMLVDDHLHSCALCRREYAGVNAAKVVTMPKRAVARRWVLATVAAALTIGVGLAAPSVLDRVLTPEGPRATVASIEGTLVAVSSEGVKALTVGAAIEEAQEIRTGKESHAIVRLRDGSLVEMRERSELSIEEKWRSKTVRLARGSVIVEAAKQREGRLEVATADALVTVHGTIFGVSAGLRGSRVSVIEGEVRVEEAGADIAILHRGDQKTTNAMERTAVSEDVSWSQNSAKYLALLVDLRSVGEQISLLPLPGLRYTSSLINRVPVDSVVVTAFPNLTGMLDEAERIFDDKAKQSAAMAEWWQKSGAHNMREAMEHIRSTGIYLGDEVITALPLHGGRWFWPK